ncbi:MAG: site-specific integrase [Desulfobacteraceae bacterium]|nr:site-specific integrase [Desulfobacteraceae bacterium]
MGMIYKRGKIFWIKYYRNGKPYRESSKSKKEPDAKRLLKKREGEISEGKLPGFYFDKVKFDELAEGFLDDYEINGKKSKARAEQCVKHLSVVFGGMKVTNISTSSIKRYIEERKKVQCMEKDCLAKFETQDNCPFCGSDKLKAGAKNATINRELSALKRMLNLGARQTPPKVDRVPYIPMLKENNTRKGFFEHGDFLALRLALPAYLKGFATFAYKTGWRVSEISGLTWNQVDRDQGIVRLEVGETKNDEGRTVYLDEELKEVIETQWENRKKNKTLSPCVFTNEDGSNRVKDFRKAWDKACKNAGIGRRLFHDFRRTAVRNMVRSGIPEQVAMKVSGHKTRSVFDRYNIVSDADLKMAAQRQEIYLKSQMGTKTGTIVDLGTKKEVSNDR